MMHLMCMGTFAVAVMPDMPKAFHKACTEPAPAEPAASGFAQIFLDATAEWGSYKYAASESEVVVQDDSEPADSAMIVVSFASTAARRLQQYVVVADEEEAPAEAPTV